MKILRVNEDKEKYNEEPVFYCTKCLSLKIRSVERLEDSEYCDDCGSTCIEKLSIDEWESLYKKKFNHRYLETY